MYTPESRVNKDVHPAAKMCTQGAGCTLNFETLFNHVNASRIEYEPFGDS